MVLYTYFKLSHGFVHILQVKLWFNIETNTALTHVYEYVLIYIIIKPGISHPYHNIYIFKSDLQTQIPVLSKWVHMLTVRVYT